MKKQGYIIALLAIVVAGGLIYWLAGSELTDPNEMQEVTVRERITNDAFNIEFYYYAGPDGYSLIESTDEMIPQPAIKHAYILMETPAYITYQGTSTESGEAPPAISLFVFDKPSVPKDASTTREALLEEWARSESAYTTINLAKGAPEFTEIDGIRALHYFTDGLYQQEVYVVEHRGHMYLLIGQYDHETDDIKRAFGELVSTISFL